MKKSLTMPCFFKRLQWRHTWRQSALLCIAALGLLTGSAHAQSDFPNKPVNLIVPFPPGGVVDQSGRSIAQALFKLWKQPVVIVTKAGAGGAVGMSAAANAAPDGYTLLATHPSILSVPDSERIFGRTPSFDRSNFTPLALMVADPLVLVVKADAPWKTYEEFVADARKNPDTIAYSSSGAYSAVHLPIEMLTHAASIKLRHIPYSGGGPALTAVLSGVVAATAGAPAVLAPQIKSGLLRALVNTGVKRHALLPDVPTAIELGYKDVEFYLWVGLFAPVKTDEALVQTLRRDIGRATQEAEFVQHMGKLGAPLDYRDGPAFSAFLNKDAERINAAIKRIGKVD
jgi:tripartite-type tricarboxylate transporter receptor subunit TctC